MIDSIIHKIWIKYKIGLICAPYLIIIPFDALIFIGSHFYQREYDFWYVEYSIRSIIYFYSENQFIGLKYLEFIPIYSLRFNLSLNQN